MDFYDDIDDYSSEDFAFERDEDDVDDEAQNCYDEEWDESSQEEEEWEECWENISKHKSRNYWNHVIRCRGSLWEKVVRQKNDGDEIISKATSLFKSIEICVIRSPESVKEFSVKETIAILIAFVVPRIDGKGNKKFRILSDQIKKTFDTVTKTMDDDRFARIAKTHVQMNKFPSFLQFCKEANISFENQKIQVIPSPLVEVISNPRCEVECVNNICVEADSPLYEEAGVKSYDEIIQEVEAIQIAENVLDKIVDQVVGVRSVGPFGFFKTMIPAEWFPEDCGI